MYTRLDLKMPRIEELHRLFFLRTQKEPWKTRERLEAHLVHLLTLFVKTRKNDKSKTKNVSKDC